MEKFEIRNDTDLKLFDNFLAEAKENIAAIINEIKNNIKKYEDNIKSAETQITEATSAREKCESEITKMENKIGSIKETIDNVENTYDKIVEAYATTSKGETKDIYSDIIESAKISCDRDVEKNRNDIARLNSDIEAIKNNIQEFNHQIDNLKNDRDSFRKELEKFTTAYEYLEKTNKDITNDLDAISKDTIVKPPVKTVEPIKEKKQTFNIEEEIKPVEIEEPTALNEPIVIDDALQRIYDLTGYKKGLTKEETESEEIKVEPEKESKAPVEPSIEEPQKSVYTDNLENLFATPSEDVVLEPIQEDYNDADMFEWESILNDTDNQNNENNGQKQANEESIIPEKDNTVDELLKPYGTTFDRLKSIVGDNITYKDGSSKPFEMTSDDVIKAINAVDGNDLKAMKTVGPEITLIRIIKKMKEVK